MFGELYFLLEYRDQTIDLMYADEEAGGSRCPTTCSSSAP